MDRTKILIPVFALVTLTLLVLARIPYKRISSALRGDVAPGDFALGESARVPPDVSLPNRNYMNLLEAPLLFYVACLTAYVTSSVDSIAIALAWAYVALRVCHSVVHLTYNKVTHRLLPFAASNLVLAAIWLRIAVAVL
jgi:hypothetical protein